MVTRYEIKKNDAGQGGFGKVARAFDVELERDVAIKILDPLFVDKPRPEDCERFRREARTLASLTHPAIPAIYDISIDEEQADFRIIFEWISGTTFTQWLQEKGPISLDEARRWFQNICGALTHAHSKEIVHRDIKPSNLIITEDCESCYLVDFGIALRKDDYERLTGGYGIGTPGYMPPEQEQGDLVDATADVYSLGIVLYECLSGQRPSIGSYRSLTSFNEAIPSGVDDLIKRCLEPPGRRPKSAMAFYSALMQALTPHANITDILSQGTLYEIEYAVSQMSPIEFNRLKKGQRVLIITRLRDLVSVDSPKMHKAISQLLGSLVAATQLESADDFKYIVSNCLQFGYEKQMGDWIGDSRPREALNDVAIHCSDETHAAISVTFLEFINKLDDIENKPKWYFHDLRILLQNLLANPNCGDDVAEQLGDLLTKINSCSHNWASGSLGLKD